MIWQITFIIGFMAGWFGRAIVLMILNQGVKDKMETKDLKKWRKDSDNFKGSSKDRDKLFKELDKRSKR